MQVTHVFSSSALLFFLQGAKGNRGFPGLMGEAGITVTSSLQPFPTGWVLPTFPRIRDCNHRLYQNKPTLSWSEFFECVFCLLRFPTIIQQKPSVLLSISCPQLNASQIFLLNRSKSRLGNGGTSHSTDEKIVFCGSLSHGRHLWSLLPSSPQWDRGYFPRTWTPSSHPLWFTDPFRSVFLNFSLLQIFVAVLFSVSLLFICWGRNTWTRAHLWRSEDSSLGVASLFYQMGLGNQTWIAGLGGKSLHPLSHLAGP